MVKLTEETGISILGIPLFRTKYFNKFKVLSSEEKVNEDLKNLWYTTEVKDSIARISKWNWSEIDWIIKKQFDFQTVEDFLLKNKLKNLAKKHFSHLYGG